MGEFVRKEVRDWDEEEVARARFKAFSGQREDWEHHFLFWRDLIFKVARHLRLFVIHPSEVKSWFVRGGLMPLCIDNVLLEMYNNGDIFTSGDLMTSTSRRLYQVFKRVGHFIGMSKSSHPQEILADHLILRPLLQERATEVIKLLSDSHWTSTCVITMAKFQSICEGSDEASIIQNYLSGCGKVRHLSIRKIDLIEGVKVSLVSTAVPNVSSLDYDSLYLIWTTEKLQQQLSVIDQRYEKARRSALGSLKSGNKPAAQRHIRLSKMISETRAKCTVLLNRVEEVLGVIENAESTKQVSEAIQIGARAIKENAISIEEVHVHLEELNESVASQKQVEDALESMPLQYTDIEDEDVEEEFKKLELELGDEIAHVPNAEPVEGSHSGKEVRLQESVEVINDTFSNLKLEAA